MDTLIYITDCSPLTGPQLYEKAYEAVSADRRSASSRFRQEKDRLLCLGAGLLEQYCGLSVHHDESGRPHAEKDGCYVSISHSYPYAVLGISGSPLGVDIEQVTDRYEAIMRRFYLDEDRAYIAASNDPAYAFFELWTRKEAFIKKNTPQDMRQISVSKPEEGMEYISHSVPGYACTAYVDKLADISFTEISIEVLLQSLASDQRMAP